MSKSNLTEEDFLAYALNGVAMPAYGSNLYIALHTADPTDAGDQLTNEAAWTGYARVAIARDNSGNGFTTSGNPRSNATLKQFPICTGAPETNTHVSIGRNSSGASQIIYSGILNSSIAVSNTIQPQFSPGALQISED